MKTSHGSRVLQIAFSLVLSGVPIAFAQIDYILANRIQPTSVGWGPLGASASRFVSTGGFTNQLVAIHSVPSTMGDLDPGFTSSMPPSRQRGQAELSQSSLANRVRLEDLLGAASQDGWRIGGGGVMSYTTRDRRWLLVFRYAPDLSALRDEFDHLHSFSLVCQFSFGKRKPT